MGRSTVSARRVDNRGGGGHRPSQICAGKCHIRTLTAEEKKEATWISPFCEEGQTAGGNNSCLVKARLAHRKSEHRRKSAKHFKKDKPLQRGTGGTEQKPWGDDAWRNAKAKMKNATLARFAQRRKACRGGHDLHSEVLPAAKTMKHSKRVGGLTYINQTYYYCKACGMRRPIAKHREFEEYSCGSGWATAASKRRDDVLRDRVKMIRGRLKEKGLTELAKAEVRKSIGVWTEIRKLLKGKNDGATQQQVKEKGQGAHSGGGHDARGEGKPPIASVAYGAMTMREADTMRTVSVKRSQEEEHSLAAKRAKWQKDTEEIRACGGYDTKAQ